MRKITGGETFWTTWDLTICLQVGHSLGEHTLLDSPWRQEKKGVSLNKGFNYRQNRALKKSLICKIKDRLKLPFNEEALTTAAVATSMVQRASIKQF